MKAPDSGCRIASSAQFLCSAFAARYVYFTSQRSQVSRPGRPPHKSNFYCHPGRAGGTPMLLVASVQCRKCGYEQDVVLFRSIWAEGPSAAKGGRREADRERDARVLAGVHEREAEGREGQSSRRSHAG